MDGRGVRRTRPAQHHGQLCGAGLHRGHGVLCRTLSEERRGRLIAETHDKRAGRPDDVVDLVCFLASPGARHIAGQTWHVNGGAFTTG